MYSVFLYICGLYFRSLSPLAVTFNKLFVTFNNQVYVDAFISVFQCWYAIVTRTGWLLKTLYWSSLKQLDECMQRCNQKFILWCFLVSLPSLSFLSFFPPFLLFSLSFPCLEVAPRVQPNGFTVALLAPSLVEKDICSHQTFPCALNTPKICLAFK